MTASSKPNKPSRAHTPAPACDNNINNTPVNKGGRPTLYKPEYNEQVYKLCLLGATDAEIADIIGVDERTINRWKDDYPEFCQSMRAGKIEADSTVAHRLYQVATGYEHEEDVIMQYQGQPVIVPTVKHYQPDTKAAFLWLKNRQPDKWRDAQEINVNNRLTIDVAPATLEQCKAAVQLREHFEQACLDVPGEVIDAKTDPI